MTLLLIIITFVVTFLVTRKYYKPQTLSAEKLLKDGKHYRLIDKYRSEEGIKEPLTIYCFQKVSAKDKVQQKGKAFFVSSSNLGIAFSDRREVKNGQVYKANDDWTGKVILS